MAKHAVSKRGGVVHHFQPIVRRPAHIDVEIECDMSAECLASHLYIDMTRFFPKVEWKSAPNISSVASVIGATRGGMKIRTIAGNSRGLRLAGYVV